MAILFKDGAFSPKHSLAGMPNPNFPHKRTGGCVTVAAFPRSWRSCGSAGRKAFLWQLITLIAAFSGCAIHGSKWSPPRYAPKWHVFQESPCHPAAQKAYAEALKAESRGQLDCVDQYFQVARMTAHSGCRSADCGCRRLHENAVCKLIETGQCLKRIDLRRGLHVWNEGQSKFVPLSYEGFAWKTEDFNRLIPVGDYRTRKLNSYHRRQGAGIPFVVERAPQVGRVFMPEHSYFAATLFFEEDASGNCSMRLVNSKTITTLELQGSCVPIARDTTAPIAYRLSQESGNPIESFLAPYSSAGDQTLTMREPYQRGKIPVVLVHGLLSDPYAWANMVNDLESDPWFTQRYQIWLYAYPTGQSFLFSAAGLREKLVRIREYCDPNRRDKAFSEMVLVGHSMGGLVSKLQVTCSGDTLWRAAANRPLDQLVMPEAFRQRIARSFFFQPSPDVSRVVYIGTPHRGSSLARSSVGRLGSLIVQLPEEPEASYEAVIAANPGVVSDELSRRLPTSIDLLNPKSDLLQAMARLPQNDRVTVHSIIGDYRWAPLNGWTDGVVPVSSAKESRSVSECFITQKHTLLHQDPKCVEEVARILRQHWAECQLSLQRNVPPTSLRSLPVLEQVTEPDAVEFSESASLMWLEAE